MFRRLGRRAHIRLVLPLLLAGLAMLTLTVRRAARPIAVQPGAGHRPPAAADPVRSAPPNVCPMAVLPHRDWVSFVNFSPDGRWLATGSEDRSARIWDARTGALVTTLGGHGDWVDPVLFSPDGRHAATCSADRQVRLWELPSGSRTAVLQGHHAYVLHAAWSPDGATLVTVGNDGEALFWRVPDGRPLGRLTRVQDVLFTTGGLVAQRSDGQLGRIELPAVSWRPWPGDTLAFAAVASRDGSTVLTRGKGGAVRSFTPAGRPLGASMAVGSGPLALSADGRTWASWANGAVTVVDTGSRAGLWRLPYGGMAPVQLALSSDGRYVAAVDPSHQVWVWALPTGRLVIHRTAPPELHGMYLDAEAIAFSPDGHRFAAAGTPRQADLWRLP